MAYSPSTEHNVLSTGVTIYRHNDDDSGDEQNEHQGYKFLDLNYSDNEYQAKIDQNRMLSDSDATTTHIHTVITTTETVRSYENASPVHGKHVYHETREETPEGFTYHSVQQFEEPSAPVPNQRIKNTHHDNELSNRQHHDSSHLRKETAGEHKAEKKDTRDAIQHTDGSASSDSKPIIDKNYNVNMKALADKYSVNQQPVSTPQRSNLSSKPVTINTGDEFCKACKERVYVMDKLLADNFLYHKNCFKCNKCRKILSLGTFTLDQGVPYCKPHFMEIFRNAAGNVSIDRDTLDGNVSEDIVRHDEHPSTEELPPPDTTRNMLAKFREMELQKQQTPAPVNPIPGRNPSFRQQQQASFLRGSESRDDENNSAPYANNTQRPSLSVNPVEELPEEGTTRNLLNIWTNKASDVSTDGGVNKSQSFHSQKFQASASSDVHFHNDGGFVASKSHGVHSPSKGADAQDRIADIIRADDPAPDELPPPEMAKSVAAMFRAMESSNAVIPNPEFSNRINQKAREGYSVNSNIRLPNVAAASRTASSSSFENEGHTTITARANGNAIDLARDETCENIPKERTDVVKAGNTSGSVDDLPEEGITKKLKARFQTPQTN